MRFWLRKNKPVRLGETEIAPSARDDVALPDSDTADVPSDDSAISEAASGASESSDGASVKTVQVEDLPSEVQPAGAPPLDINWHAPISAEVVRDAFRVVMRRDVGNHDPYPASLEQAGFTLAGVVETFLTSEEFAQIHARRVALKATAADGSGFVPDPVYRSPSDLSVTHGERPHVLLIGSCLMDSWGTVLTDRPGGPTVTRLFSVDVPPMSAEEAARYDYQIIQIPIRLILPDGLVFGLRVDDETGYADAFEVAAQRLGHALESALRYQRDHGLTAFVLNLLPPQQNSLGRLAPRYALSNPVHFVERLNERLAALIAERTGTYLVDFDGIVSTIGRRYFQDDVVLQNNHGGIIGPILMEADINRLEPVGDVYALYGDNQWRYVMAVFQEIDGMYRTIRQLDSIKIVIFDLDDTLWRGVAADSDVHEDQQREGWPLGIVEAAAYLWRRGIAIAIVSKNDEELASRIWERVYGQVFPLENFVVRRINWEPKAENIREILSAVNLLPGSALFVDDNPVERAQVQAAFPDIRVLGGSVALWRRLLLWAPELQTATFTAESARRTEMLQRQIERDATRTTGDRADFLASLGLELRVTRVRAVGEPAFARCFELLNKTNQFNTTGRRWTPADMAALLASEDGHILALAAKDRFTEYGIVAIAVIRGEEIVQVVMSCRVFGMGVERTLMSVALADLRAAGREMATGEIVATDRNRLSLMLFEDSGFEPLGESTWQRTLADPLDVPTHVTLFEDREAMPA